METEEIEQIIISDYNSVILNLGSRIRDGSGWLLNQWVKDDYHGGWPVFEGGTEPDPWAGIALCLFALSKVDNKSNDPKFHSAISWLREHQLPDGGWWIYNRPSVSNVRVTSWCLLALKQANVDPSDEVVEGAVCYLKEAAMTRSDGCCWGPSDSEDLTPMIHPTILAVWALTGSDTETARKGAEWLESKFNSDGSLPMQDPTAEIGHTGMTALGLYVLSRSGYISSNSELFQAGIDWLSEKQDPETGEWEMDTEEWTHNTEQGNIASSIYHPNTCWALLALLEADISLDDRRILNAVQSLVKQQDERSGAFRLPNDGSKPIFYSSYCIISLSEFNRQISSAKGIYDIIDARIDYFESRVSKLDQRIKFYIIANSLLLLFLMAAVLGVIGSTVESVLNTWEILRLFIVRNQTPLVIGVLVSFIATMIVVGIRKPLVRLINKYTD